MPDGKSARVVRILLTLAVMASGGYLMLDGIYAGYIVKGNRNIFLAVYFMCIIGFFIAKRGLRRTRRGDQLLCISFIGFPIVLFLTTEPQIWTVIYAVIFVAIPSVFSLFLLKKDREKQEPAYQKPS